VQTVRKSTKRSLKIGRVSGKIKKRVSQIWGVTATPNRSVWF
jgi:hypothetical protein